MPVTVMGDSSLRTKVAIAVGVAAAIAGGFVTVRAGLWMVADMGWTVSGATPEDRLAIVLPVALGVVILLIGIAALLGRRSPSRAQTLVLGVATAAVLASPFVLGAYPQPEPVVLVGLEPDTGNIRWRTELPVNHVFGYQTFDHGILELEGRKDERGCTFELRAVYVDEASGAVVDHHDLPEFHLDEESAPPPAKPLDDLPFVAEGGHTPFSCSR